MSLVPYLPDTIWLQRYPVRYAGTRFDARMTVVRLKSGRLMLHSPSAIDAALAREIAALGQVSAIVAPGTFHHLHVPSAQAAFPTAKTFLCPGIEKKRPELRFNALLGDEPEAEWADDLDQVLVQGSRWMREVAFFHRASKTLILVDLVENFTDATPDASWTLKLWWKLVFRMWNRPKPAPEYQLGWSDKQAAGQSLRRILAWDFERVILSHGDLIETDAHRVVEDAWRVPLQAS